MNEALTSDAFAQIVAWDNLLLAYRKASKGKRGRESTAQFEYRLADELAELQTDLLQRNYQAGAYTNFYIHDPKRRKISAAPFRDRVVHHALCNIIEPWFEQSFIFDSYANRKGKGTHLAVDRLQQFARNYRYVLRLDIVKHFPSIDHEILLNILFRTILDADVRRLTEIIIASGEGLLEDEYQMAWFPDDDLLALARPRGLPIGNLTSQFWSNCYLNPLDHFIKRELRCPAYLRYVDDMALFSNNKAELWQWRQAVIKRLENLRLTVHPHAQVVPVDHGIPWLGFIVYPQYRRIKARNVQNFERKIHDRWQAFCDGAISFAEFDCTVQGWINHVRYADSWGLRTHVLGKPLISNRTIRESQLV